MEEQIKENVSQSNSPTVSSGSSCECPKCKFSLPGILLIVLAAVILGGVVGYLCGKKSYVKSDESSAIIPTSTQSSNLGDGWKYYEDETLGFSLEYPSSWTVSLGNSHAPTLPEQTINFQSKQGVFDVSISFVENPDKNSSESHIISYFKDRYPSELLTSNPTEVELDNGNKVYQTYYDQSALGEITRIIVTQFEKHPKYFYIKTQVSLNPETLEVLPGSNGLDCLNVYQKILPTFKFLD